MSGTRTNWSHLRARIGKRLVIGVGSWVALSGGAARGAEPPPPAPGEVQAVQTSANSDLVWVSDEHPGAAAGAALAGGGLLAIGAGSVIGGVAALSMKPTGESHYILPLVTMVSVITPTAVVGSITLGIGGYHATHWRPVSPAGSGKGRFMRREDVESDRLTSAGIAGLGGVLCAISVIGFAAGPPVLHSASQSFGSGDSGTGVERERAGIALIAAGGLLSIPSTLLLGIGFRSYKKYDYALHPERYASTGTSELVRSLSVTPYASSTAAGLSLAGSF